MVTTVTTDGFASFISAADMPVIIDFWASWCGPCRSFSKVIDKIADDFDGRILVGKVNVDEEPKLSEKFRVMSIPTLCVFDKGELKETLVGSRSYDDMVNLLGMYLV